MKSRRFDRLMFGIALVILVVFTSHAVDAVLPPGNSVQQWNKISEDTVVASGAFGNEGLTLFECGLFGSSGGATFPFSS